MSVEFLILIACIYILTIWNDWANSIARSLSSSSEAIKWAALLPVGMGVWIFINIRHILFPKETDIIVIQQLPDYWKFKDHFYVTIIYTILFILMAIIPWIIGFDLQSGRVLTIFVSGIVGQCIVALTVYIGNIRLKEIINQFK